MFPGLSANDSARLVIKTFLLTSSVIIVISILLLFRLSSVAKLPNTCIYSCINSWMYYMTWLIWFLTRFRASELRPCTFNDALIYSDKSVIRSRSGLNSPGSEIFSLSFSFLDCLSCFCGERGVSWFCLISSSILLLIVWRYIGCIKSPILKAREYSFQIESISADGVSVSLSTKSINVLKTYLLVCFSSKAVSFSKTSSTSTNSLLARRSRNALCISLNRWRALNGRLSADLLTKSTSETASVSVIAIWGVALVALHIRLYSERIPGL